MSTAISQTYPLESPLFRRRLKRLWRVSVSLTMLAHGLASAALVYGLVASVFGISSHPSDGRQAAGDAPVVAGSTAPVKPDTPMELADLPPPAPTLPGIPAGLDPTLYKRLIALGYKDFKDKKPAELAAALEKLTPQAAKISNTALSDIGRFLGRKKGSYVPRTRYKNELNPNANFIESKIIAAKMHKPKSGTVGYTIMLEDKEKDRFIFTLEGKPAQTLAAAGPHIKGKPLGAVVAGEKFELKGARIEDIRRWKKTLPKRGTRGSIVTWIDVQQREVVMYLDKKRYAPFTAEQGRFMYHRRGFTDNGTTFHCGHFDHRSATLYKVEDITKPGGKPRARTILIDIKGERFITISEGAAAEKTLASTKLLKNPAINRIYQKTMMHLLPSFGNANKPTRPKPKKETTP